ncbi:MAG: hypothetical protein ABI542_00085 [Gemmatimonadota bacterium]
MFVRRLTFLAILPVLACAPKAAEPDVPAPPPEPAELTIHMTDYTFAAPDTVAPGVTKIRIIDDGKQSHHAILMRIDSGKTMVDYMAAVKEGNYQPAWMTAVGGGGAIMAGGENSTYSDLTPGLYLVACFLQDTPDAPPHMALGMVKPIVVVGERTIAVMPEADAEIKLVDFSFEMPDTLPSGDHNIRVVNGGTEGHEAVMIRLPEGMSLDGFLAQVKAGNDRVGEVVGGNGALSVGGSNVWHVTLTPGTYAIVCFVPSPTDGTPHVMKGMAKQITVS